MSLVDELSKLHASLKRTHVTEAVSPPLQAGLLETLEAAHAMLTLPVREPTQGSDSMLATDESTDESDTSIHTTSVKFQQLTEPTEQSSKTKTWRDVASKVLCFGGLLQAKTGVLVWAGTSVFLALTLLVVSARSFFTSGGEPEVNESLVDTLRLDRLDMTRQN